jgi:prevent-host-death family protein
MLMGVSQTVSVRELNQHTSAVLERVRDGEELVITSSGRPLARLIPFRPRDTYERMVAEGRIRPAKTRGIQITRTFPGGADLDAVLEEERADRDSQL